jgi:hypothetical protein
VTSVPKPFRPIPTFKEPTRHDGIDIAAPGGAAIRAAASGTVTRAVKGWNGGYGWIVVIDHGNNISTSYAHLSELSVAVGERVRVGRKIGAVGSTGLSTGPHLHFELRPKGTPLDPLLTLPEQRVGRARRGHQQPAAPWSVRAGLGHPRGRSLLPGVRRCGWVGDATLARWARAAIALASFMAWPLRAS